MTLAACINIILSLAALGGGAELVLTGVVCLVRGKPERDWSAIGDVLFIRLCVSMIVAGLFAFGIGAILTARLMA